MAQQHLLRIADQRAATPRLRWLTLEAPELARGVRPGQYLLLRCTGPGSYDPLLRRALFVAAAEPALGQIGLLYEPDERGRAWLARGRPGDMLDAIGPLGQPFAIGAQARNLLLIGQGPGLAALLLLARAAAARGCAVTVLAGAAHADALPPPFLLPGEVEYQGFAGLQISDFRLQIDSADTKSTIYNLQSAITWADQLFAALPDDQIPALRDAVRAVRYRWARGFASALLEGPIICGVGACGVCATELRKRTRLLCSDGPVFDLRDVIEDRG
jgi:dihydroorotate dehydrogenase electron transfer subunit